ncbi:hypothetical protein ACFVTY_30125 [Streptomyces sp. NPDC058067]|uniref:hypothetical protein n=1 Tax=Streptomyces sp. NPDC058067 TaxID=3346324 RepID=UPI0036E18784
MQIVMLQMVANVISDVPDEARDEIIMLLDAVSKDTSTQAQNLTAAFGEWCWLIYTAHGNVVEILDVGCAR